MQCVIVTPESTSLERTADSIVVTLFDGELGVLPGHAPLIGRLGPGELRLTNEDETERFYVGDGFVEVLEDTVTLLTGKAVPAKEISLADAEKLLEEAKSKSGTKPEEIALRETAVAQSRAMVKVAKKANAS